MGTVLGERICLPQEGQLYQSFELAPIHICFTPQQQCLPLILSEIRNAQKEILVQAYSFTSMPIAQALISAKKKGINVRVIADKSQETAKGTTIPSLVSAGIDVRIDSKVAIAHNKVLIIDRAAVVSGSYNWTVSAEKRNAENIFIVRDEKIAASYRTNWLNRYHVGSVRLTVSTVKH